jgi:hypothetical protein
MGEARLFSDKEINFEDYLTTISNAMVECPVVSCRVNFEKGVNALLDMNDNEKRKKLIDTSIVADQVLTASHTKTNDLFHKLPVMMTLANFIGNYYDTIKELSNEQLALLGMFSFAVFEEHMPKHLEFFANIELLQAVLNKTQNRFEQLDILSVIEDKYFDFCIDKKEGLELNNFRDEMTELVNNSPKAEILAMRRPLEDIWEDVINTGLRI